MSSEEVDAWLAGLKADVQPAMRRVTGIILGADDRLTAFVKYRTLTFAFGGDLAAFVQVGKWPVSLMFNRGGAIPGSFPHLEGSGPTARFMRFADLDAVDALASELAAIARAWCELRASAAEASPHRAFAEGRAQRASKERLESP